MSRKAGSAVCLAMMITAHLLTRAWPHGHLLASGSFHQVTHKGSGEARIYRLSDASLLLAIRSFRTAYVPDLEVLLVANTDAPITQRFCNQDAYIWAGSRLRSQ